MNEKRYVTWSDIEDACQKVVHLIQQEHYQPTLIVAIARGGLSIAHIISKHLQETPIASCMFRSYGDGQQVSAPQLLYGCSGPVRDQKIIVVDDIADTGATLRAATTYLVTLGALQEDIRTCTLYRKTHANIVPDFIAQTCDQWIVFPWEQRV